MAMHSSILAWRIPWTEEPGGLQSMCRKESNMTQQLNNNSFIKTDTNAKGIDKYECDIWRNRSHTFDSKI